MPFFFPFVNEAPPPSVRDEAPCPRDRVPLHGSSQGSSSIAARISNTPKFAILAGDNAVGVGDHLSAQRSGALGLARHFSSTLIATFSYFLAVLSRLLRAWKLTKPSMTPQSIFALPVSPLAPIYHLPPDPLFPTPSSLLALSSYVPPHSLSGPGPIVLKEGDAVPPSMLRRSRMIRNGGAFSFSSPLPLEFPYNLQAEEGKDAQRKEVGEEVLATAETIETKLARFELDPQFPVGEGEERATAFESVMRKAEGFPKPVLLSLSMRCLEEWLPQLDVGKEGGTEGEKRRRELLLGVLGGRTVLAREPVEGAEEEVERSGFAPWALCYGGVFSLVVRAGLCLRQRVSYRAPVRKLGWPTWRRSGYFYP